MRTLHRTIVTASLAIGLGVALAIASAAARAQQPLKILVGFAAGGSADIIARFVAERLREPLGRTVLVENRPGAGGRLVVEATRVAPPDGTTLMLIPSGPMVLFPHIFRETKYDPVRDFTPIVQIARQDLCFTVGPAVPASATGSLAALRDWIRANPSKATYASAGTGTLQHFVGVLFAQQTGLDLVHVPYKGAAPAATDLIGGQVPMMASSCTELLAYHRSGKARILATTGTERSQLTPDVPTFREQGFDIVMAGRFALYGPAKLPDAIAQPITKAVLDIVATPDGRASILKLGMEPDPGLPVVVTANQLRDFATIGEVVKSSGFKPID